MKKLVQTDLFGGPDIDITAKKRRDSGETYLYSLLKREPGFHEMLIAEILYKLSLASSGVSLDLRSRMLFLTYFKKHILPKIVSDIAEEIRDFAGLLQSHDDQPEQQEDQNT